MQKYFIIFDGPLDGGSSSLQNGVDVKTLSGMLGRYCAGFTLDTYGHISTQMQQDAAQKVGGFLR